jgi:hypothetical protein
LEFIFSLFTQAEQIGYWDFIGIEQGLAYQWEPFTVMAWLSVLKVRELALED